MTSGGDNFTDFSENELTNNFVYTMCLKKTTFLAITRENIDGFL